MAGDTTRTHELTIAADVVNLRAIAKFMVKVATEAGFDDSASYAVQMAVDEACANIIEHAYQEGDDGSIRLVCEIGADGLTITIFDKGAPFEPNTIPEFDPTLPLEERGHRGMGMFLIKNLMDTVDYRFNTAEGNRLTLFKRKHHDER